ncbi:MAG: hypothetical protein Fur0022_17260 [Anaerolineales bacterium]
MGNLITQLPNYKKRLPFLGQSFGLWGYASRLLSVLTARARRGTGSSGGGKGETMTGITSHYSKVYREEG